MIARSESWSERRPESRQALAAAALGLVLFFISFGILHTGPFDGYEIVDTPTYKAYGDAIVGGQVPYRDFGLEYPPGALPMFALPSLAPSDDYRPAFEALVALCGAATIVFAVAALVAVGARPERLYAAAAFLGLAPLALGPVLLTRFDVWPAMLTVGALAALVSGRSRLAFAVLGLAVAAKLYPLVLLPIALLYLARRKGGRETALALAVFLLVLAVVFVPFAALAPDGLQASFERQTGRPLQIESLGSAALLAAQQLGGYEPDGRLQLRLAESERGAAGRPRHHSDRASGGRRGRASGSSSPCAAARGRSSSRAGRPRCARSSRSARWSRRSSSCGSSPSYPSSPDGEGLAASGLLAAALVLTQLWFPSRYWDLVAAEPGPVWLLVARNVVLVALAAVAVAAMARSPAPSRSE